MTIPKTKENFKIGKDVVKLNNRKLGDTFEQTFCELLSENGFWVHFMSMNRSGQPADVIAVRNRIPFLIDCKNCSKNRFPLSRIEDNQHLAMSKWKDCGNGSAWFAVRVFNDIYMISYDTCNNLIAQGKKHISNMDFDVYGFKLDEWMVRYAD